MTDRIPLDHLTSDQLDGLYDRLERVRALHQPMQRGALQVCAHCSGWDEQRQRCFGVLADYPCDTLRALDGPQDGPETPDAGAETPETLDGAQAGDDGLDATDTAADDLTGYWAPDPPIGCITATTAPAHDAGPSIADCKADDARWWNGEREGQ